MPSDIDKQENVGVRLRDGVTLRLNLYRPAAADGPLPVLLSAHPYGRDALPRRTRRGWSVNRAIRCSGTVPPTTRRGRGTATIAWTPDAPSVLEIPVIPSGPGW